MGNWGNKHLYGRISNYCTNFTQILFRKKFFESLLYSTKNVKMEVYRNLRKISTNFIQIYKKNKNKNSRIQLKSLLEKSSSKFWEVPVEHNSYILQ